MYNAHFGFRESPFGVTPDPQFYYSNAVNREAWATLRYGIEERKGFIVIVGEAGTGKTTLLRKAMHSSGSDLETAYICHTLVGGTGLLSLILTDLGLPDCAENSAAMIARLYQYAIEQFNSDKIVALLIDEAQDLSPHCLEELRLLGNLETDKQKLLQIVLVGQPELEQKLDRPELHQLKQRIALRCRLEPVKSEEVGAYIDSRLQAIGRRSADVFEPQAIEKIAAYSNGIPRLINIVCDNALLIAYSMSKSKVSADMVQEVADDLLIDKSCRQQEKPAPTAVQPIQAQAPLEFAPPPKVDSKHTEEQLAETANDRVVEIRKNRIDSRIAVEYSRRASRAAAIALSLIVVGGFLYSNLPDGASSDPVTPAGAAHLADDPKEPDQVEPDASAQDTIVAASSSSSISLPPEEDIPVSATAVPAAEQNVPRSQPEAVATLPAVEKHVSAQPASIRPTKFEGKQSSRPVEDKKEKNSNGADFLVVGPLFVRAQPTAGAPIIDTLSPGTSISVAALNGDYYRIRALGTNPIRGYVHKEDAFFERKK
jgi:type II secretory pathway predicted ATPase ExeA